MKFLCLIYLDETESGTLAQSDLDSLHLKSRTHVELLHAGVLEASNAAVTLRRRDASVLVSDGPYSNTREQLRGLALLDAPNLDAAIRVAAHVPAAHSGSIEIRPVRTAIPLT